MFGAERAMEQYPYFSRPLLFRRTLEVMIKRGVGEINEAEIDHQNENTLPLLELAGKNKSNLVWLFAKVILESPSILRGHEETVFPIIEEAWKRNPDPRVWKYIGGPRMKLAGVSKAVPIIGRAIFADGEYIELFPWLRGMKWYERKPIDAEFLDYLFENNRYDVLNTLKIHIARVEGAGMRYTQALLDVSLQKGDIVFEYLLRDRRGTLFLDPSDWMMCRQHIRKAVSKRGTEDPQTFTHRMLARFHSRVKKKGRWQLVKKWPADSPRNRTDCQRENPGMRHDGALW
jgi:hypothetical protein